MCVARSGFVIIRSPNPWYNIWFLISLTLNSCWTKATTKKQFLSYGDWVILMYLPLAGIRHELTNNFQLDGMVIAKYEYTNFVSGTNIDTISKWCLVLKIHRHTPNAFHQHLDFRFFFFQQLTKIAIKWDRFSILPNEKWSTITSFWQLIGVDCTGNMIVEANVEKP